MGVYARELGDFKTKVSPNLKCTFPLNSELSILKSTAHTGKKSSCILVFCRFGSGFFKFAQLIKGVTESFNTGHQLRQVK